MYHQLKEENGIKKHLRMKVVGNRLRKAGHIQRMSEDILIKRTWKTEEGGTRRRRKPNLRRRNSAKRDL